MGPAVRLVALRVLVVVIALLVSDFLAGWLYRTFNGESFYYQVIAPDRGLNRRYRTASALYHHDLHPNAAAPAVWGLGYFVYTNSLGFRDREVREVPLDSGRERILLIGDSFTEGVRIDFEETFAGLLAEALGARGIDVLNAGVSSYSPTIYERKVRYLIDDVRLHFSRLVVLLDISDIEDEAKDYARDADGNVRHQRRGGSQVVENFKGWLRGYSILYGVPRLFEKDPPPRSPDAPNASVGNPRARWTVDDGLYESWGRRGLRAAAESMDRLAALLRAHGIPLTLVVYPWPTQIDDGNLESRQVVFWREWSREHGAQFVDLFPAFITDDPEENQRAIEDLFIRHDFHWNEAGHRRVAEELMSALIPQGRDLRADRRGGPDRRPGP